MKGKNLGLFDFKSFIEELRWDEKKSESIIRYESVFGKMPNSIWKCSFFKDYLRFFAPVKYTVPEGIKNDFNYDLLLRLTAASFSSEYKLSNTGLDIELFITVASDNEKTTKSISELWSFQIFRLFEIYLEEQINLATLIYSVTCKKLPKGDSLEKLFITPNVKKEKENFPSFEEYLKSCSYLQLSEEGFDLTNERYKRLIKYKMNIAKIEDINSIFYSTQKESSEFKSIM